jgi:hypothetical protein
MKTGGGGSVRVDQNLLYLGTSWRLVVSFTLLPFYPQGKCSRNHWIGGWIDPRTGLDYMRN